MLLSRAIMNKLIDLDSKSLAGVTGGLKHTTNAEFLKSARKCYELPIGGDVAARLGCFDKAAGRRWDLF